MVWVVCGGFRNGLGVVCVVFCNALVLVCGWFGWFVAGFAMIRGVCALSCIDLVLVCVLLWVGL